MAKPPVQYRFENSGMSLIPKEPFVTSGLLIAKILIIKPNPSVTIAR